MKNKLYQLVNTKTLMIISAIFLAVNGFGFTFFPNEIAGLLINDDNYIFILILQILGVCWVLVAPLSTSQYRNLQKYYQEYHHL